MRAHTHLAAMLGMALILMPYPSQAQVTAQHNPVNSKGNTQPAMRESACIDPQTIDTLLLSLSAKPTDQRFLGMPKSWFKRHGADQASQPDANTAFAEAIFPALACKLKEHANALLSVAEASHHDDRHAPDSARDWFMDVLAFERNEARFRRIVLRTKTDPSEALLRELDTLLLDLYRAKLPAAVFAEKSRLLAALAKTDYREKSVRPPDMRQRISQEIERRVRSLRQGIDHEIDSGAALLTALHQAQAPLSSKLREFNAWVRTMGRDWLGPNAQDNPCRVQESWLAQTLDALTKEYGYAGELNKLTQQFTNAQCVQPSRQRLSQLQVAPYGALFLRDGEAWKFAPAIAAEVDKLQRLLSLPMMQLAPKESFVCRQPLRGWDAAILAQASTFIHEYQQYVQSAALDRPGGQKALSLWLARHQLHAVLDETMNRAQQGLAVADSTALSSEPLVEYQAMNMRRVLNMLLEMLRFHRQLGYDASHAAIVQCARQQAMQALQAMQNQAEASQLYVPKVAANSGSSAAPQHVYALGNRQQTLDYLSRELQRSQILAAQAAPFVDFMKVTEGGYHAADGGVDWEETILELNRYLNLKAPDSQVARLQALLVKQLSELTTENCNNMLAAYVPDNYGGDLFSRRRKSLVQQSRQHCTKRGSK